MNRPTCRHAPPSARGLLTAALAGAVVLGTGTAGRPEPTAPVPTAAQAPATARPPAPVQPPARETTVEVAALANAGVLVRGPEGAVLVDAVFADGIRGYATPGRELRDAFASGAPEFRDVRAILVTHWHADHFDPQAVGRFLLAHPGTSLVAAEQVVRRVEAEFDRSGELRPRIRSVTPAPGAAESVVVNGMDVTVVRLAHNPSRNFPDQHVAQAVALGGRRVIHVGDADPTGANFEPVERLAPFDVALVPYWYLLSGAGRAIVRDQLRASHVVAMHVEPGDAEAIARKVLQAWPGATVLTRERQVARF